MTRFAALALVLITAGAARAQFDPAFNHLECYSIKPTGPKFTQQLVDVETQFGTHTAVLVKKPHRLCLPAKKTGGGVDPLPATPVPHFLCYKVKFRFRERRIVELTDQFGTLLERTSKPQFLCTPVVKTLL
jgi:hypothetical protein